MPEQLKKDTSFATRLAQVLKVRKRNGIDSSTLVDVPDVGHKSLLVLVNELEIGATQVTVVNFANEKIESRIQSDRLPLGRVFDLTTRRKVGTVDELRGFTVELPTFGGLAMIVRD